MMMKDSHLAVRSRTTHSSQRFKQELTHNTSSPPAAQPGTQLESGMARQQMNVRYPPSRFVRLFVCLWVLEHWTTPRL